MSQPSCVHVVSQVCGDLNQETTHQNGWAAHRDKQFSSNPLVNCLFTEPAAHVSLYDIVGIYLRRQQYAFAVVKKERSIVHNYVPVGFTQSPFS